MRLTVSGDMGMGNRLFRHEKELAEYRPIGGVNIAIVALDELRAVPPVERWQQVPCQPRSRVVHDMKIVVEEEEGERAVILDDDRALALVCRGLVLQEGADEDQRDAE